MYRRLLRPIALLVLTSLSAFPVLADQRPNILFCIADDWGWPHAGAYGDAVVKTPTFDRIAEEGVLFNHVYVPSPSCTPCRGGILTGQAIHRLEEGGNLWSILPGKFKVYPDVLEQAGYQVGFSGKGWGPGSLKGTGRTRNPAGPRYKNFREFLEKLPDGKPFCFWFGSFDPHRPYRAGSGADAGMKAEDVQVPSWLPDTPVVRNDILDYYFEVQRFDRNVGTCLDWIRKAGKLENTLVVMTGDHGMPFPRAKCNVYDSGARVPFAVRWPAKIKPGRVVDDFVSFTDIAPTFLEAAGLDPLPEMTGRSFLDVLLSDRSGRVDPARDKVFIERERHVLGNVGHQSYPMRAIRTDEYLYIRNLRPHLWPAAEPQRMTVAGKFGDVDGSPTKHQILSRRADPAIAPFFRRAFAQRPGEELYDLSQDPHQISNAAGKAEYAEVQAKLRSELDGWMQQTADPRAAGETDIWDKCPYVGQRHPANKP